MKDAKAYLQLICATIMERISTFVNNLGIGNKFMDEFL